MLNKRRQAAIKCPTRGGTTSANREKEEKKKEGGVWRAQRNQSKGLQNIKNVIYARITLKELAINWPRRRTETSTGCDIFLFFMLEFFYDHILSFSTRATHSNLNGFSF